MSSDEADQQAAGISNLQQNFSKQQEKISALKELVLKSEVAHGKTTSSTQEKVKNIAQRLTQLKSLARSRQNLDASKLSTTTEVELQPDKSIDLSQANLSVAPPNPTNISTPKVTPNPTPTMSKRKLDLSSSSSSSNPSSGNEKIMLLRQQMEENKTRMAQRASNKLYLEQWVSELKEKIDTTQQCLDDTTELGKSMSDLSAFNVHSTAPRERHKSATDLSMQPFSLEKERNKFLENRCRLLEMQLEKERQKKNSKKTLGTEILPTNEESVKRIAELENKIAEIEVILKEREKEIIEKTSSESKLREEVEQLRTALAAKDNNEELQIIDREALEGVEQSNLSELKSENERLRTEIKEALQRVAELEKLNDEIETTRCDLTFKVDKLQEQLSEVKDELAKTKEEKIHLELKCTELEEELVQSNNTKEITDQKELVKDTDSQVQAAMAKQIQELQDELQSVKVENEQLKERLAESEKLEVSDASIAEKIASLEATIESQREDLNTRAETIRNQEEDLMEKTIELNVLNANFKVLEEKLQASSKSKPLFSSAGASDVDVAALQSENQQLKQKLDESNKSMIKLKLQCKQIEKQMKKLEKSSDLHGEIIKLQKVNEELQQKITELEDEKGQWQLTHMDDVKTEEDNSTTEKVPDDWEQKYKLQAETICLLEQQKYDQNQTIEDLRKEIESLQAKMESQELSAATRVESDWSDIHMEDQVREQEEELRTLRERLSTIENEFEEAKVKLGEIQSQRDAAEKKLEHYINENMELLDKVEKLSKSSSSAESIEIVERLTQQERAEIDEFNKRLDHEHTTHVVSEVTQTEMGPELSESLTKLREESSELMNKIELFTTERREVMEKMESLASENAELNSRIDELTELKEMYETNALLAENEKSKLEAKLQEMIKEKEKLAMQVVESSAQKAQLSQELTSLQKSSEVVAALDGQDGVTLLDKCENSLTKLNSELEAYRKANDKNAKFNASKKLAKEAKNAYTQLSELLLKVKEASTAVETVTVVETVVAVTAPNGKALAEYEQLTAQNRELKATVDELRKELEGALDAIHVPPADVPAIDHQDYVQTQNKLLEAQQTLSDYEKQCIDLQSTVEDLRMQLHEVRLSDEEKMGEITQLKDELNKLKKLSDEFDLMLNDKEMSFEKQIEHLTRLRKELEGKCDTYEGEIEILQTLVKEQKQQLIEAYQENEHELNLKLIDLQQRDEEIAQLQAELKDLKSSSVKVGEDFQRDLELETEKMRESLTVTKALVAEQIGELANKQDTIDTLNEQITTLYATIEANNNLCAEKEDEINDLKDTLDMNEGELQRLRKDNDEQKAVVDKLLNELHSHKNNALQLPQLESELLRLQQLNKELDFANKELEKHNKEQLEKMKKYAVNLKKRTARCQELEVRVTSMEKGVSEVNASTLTEIQQLKENNSHLNEELMSLKQKLEHAESLLPEIQEALQMKTVEMLEAMEGNAKLETELELLKENLNQKIQESVQLQNALAASQDKPNLYEDSSLSEKNRELNENLRTMEENLTRVQHDLLQVRETLREAEQAKIELDNNLNLKQNEIDELKQETEFLKVMQSESQTLREKYHEQSFQMTELSNQLKNKSLKFEKSKAVIKDRNAQIQRLQSQIKELQDKLSEKPEEDEVPVVVVQSSQLDAAPAMESQVSDDHHNALKEAHEKLKEEYAHEKSNFEQTVSRLETLHDGIQAKLQEDMAYIESLELENANYKEKICKLEECVASFEERRASMERRANLLDAQMQSRADEFVKTEDELIYRLNMLSEHDDVIARRLLESQEEKEELQEKVSALQQELKEINHKHRQLDKEFNAYQAEVNINLDNMNLLVREEVRLRDSEMDRVCNAYEAKLALKRTEMDELETEMNEHIESFASEKRALCENLERLRDECNEQKDEVVRLRESQNALEQSKAELERECTWLRMQNENVLQDQMELQELRIQSMQDRTDMENLRHQMESLANSHEVDLQALRTQISELDELRMQVGQNQTDDQVFIESENKRLTDLLAERDATIESYQRQNMQLQMAAAHAASTQAAHPSQSNPLALAFGMPPDSGSTAHSAADDVRRLERELAEKTELITRLQSQLAGQRQDNSTTMQQRSCGNYEVPNLTDWSSPAQPPDILPAPPMFFTADADEPSPFDEIIQARSVNHNLQSGVERQPATSSNSNGSAGQQIIEDLQRNVSDLEKHAHDLENKLVQRNQQISDQEARLRDAQHRLQDAESRVSGREQELRAVQLELQRMQQDVTDRVAAEADRQDTLNHLNGRLQEVEQQLAVRETYIKELQLKLEEAAKNARVSVEEDNLRKQINDLQNQLQQTTALLQEKDREVNVLRTQLEQEKLLQAETPSIESQILATPLTTTTHVDAPKAVDASRPSLEMFFGGSSAPDFDVIIPEISQEPVVEDVIVPKKTYVCQPGEENAPTRENTMALDIGDDWGDTWGTSEAAAEEAYIAKTSAQPLSARQSLVPREQQLELQLQEQADRIAELQTALDASEKCKEELQLKTTKLMKKLKELKSKNDELQANTRSFTKSSSVESNNMFGDLDAAIQDELRSQIKTLEKKLEEQQKEHEEHANEKDKLLKRIDVLTAGNNRMVELKDRQDMDVQMYQARIRELLEKIEQLESWDTDNSKSESKEVATDDDKKMFEEKIAELIAENKELRMDQAEWQALLDEEKSKVETADATIRNLQMQITSLKDAAASTESADKSTANDLRLEIQNLQANCSALTDENMQLKALQGEANSQLVQVQNQERQLRADLAVSDQKLKELHLEITKLQETLKERDATCDELQSQLLELQTRQQEQTQAIVELQESVKNKEMLEQKVNELESENSRLKSMSTQSTDVGSLMSNNDELNALMQEKEAEIAHLKQKVKDLMLEDQTQKLVMEILAKNTEIHMLKMQVKNLEEDKQELEHNLSLQITKELQSGKDDASAKSQDLQAKVDELQTKVGKLEEEKHSMEEELKVLNNHVISSLEQEEKFKAAALELDTKNIEIAELRKSLELLKSNLNENQNAAQSNPSGVDFVALNAKWESIVEQRCGEIAQLWKDHLDQREHEFKLVEASLREEIEELRSAGAVELQDNRKQTQLSTESTGTSSVLESSSASVSTSGESSKVGTPLHSRPIQEESEGETSAIVEKMQAALESQEMEIVTLKEQLAIRSAEYARLAAQYDPFKLQTTLSHSGMTTVASPPNSDSRNDSSLVPKAELDLALYVLHQRDLRCDELTLEIVSLLKERDTLQLKLSNTLRQMESIRTQNNSLMDVSTDAADVGASAPSDSPRKSLAAMPTNSESTDDLNMKLSQLQTVDHSKDKVIKEEREQRNRQMERIHQDVAKMPSAAMSELVGADMSKTNQSPSSVLLNWLWGNKPNPSDGPPLN